MGPSPVIDQKDQRKKGDGIVDKPKLKSTSPTEIRKEDDQDDLKKIETRTEPNIETKDQRLPQKSAKPNKGTKPEEKDKKITPKKEVLEEPKLKSKLKSVQKSEIEETPMEKLKRLENTKPTDIPEPEPEKDLFQVLVR